MFILWYYLDMNLFNVNEVVKRAVTAMMMFCVLATVYYKTHPFLSVLLFILYAESIIILYDNHKGEFWKKITVYVMCFIYLTGFRVYEKVNKPLDRIEIKNETSRSSIS